MKTELEFSAYMKLISDYVSNNRAWLIDLDEGRKAAVVQYDLCVLTNCQGELLNELVKFTMSKLQQDQQAAKSTVGDVIARYCKSLGVDLQTLLEGSQSRPYADARKVIAWTLVRRHGLSQSITAKALGYSGNASVIKALHELTNMYLTNMDFRRMLMEFCEQNNLDSPVLM